jgi:peptide deformylase
VRDMPQTVTPSYIFRPTGSRWTAPGPRVRSDRPCSLGSRHAARPGPPTTRRTDCCRMAARSARCALGRGRHARPQTPVTAYDEGLRELVADMVATMYAADGVGWPRARSAWTWRCSASTATTSPASGPWASSATRSSPCPRARPPARRGRRGLPVAAGQPRAAGASGRRPVRGLRAGRCAGGVQRRRSLARCLQHETGYTRGTVFGDRLSTRWRKKLQKAHEKVADHYPADWPVVPMLD